MNGIFVLETPVSLNRWALWGASTCISQHCSLLFHEMSQQLKSPIWGKSLFFFIIIELVFKNSAYKSNLAVSEICAVKADKKWAGKLEEKPPAAHFPFTCCWEPASV